MSNDIDNTTTTSEKQSSITVDAPETCPANTSEAGKADSCKGCPGQELCKAGAGSGRPPGKI
jgi:hypothetical protein